MKKNLLYWIILTLVISFGRLNAQKNTTFSTIEIDRLTYAQYLKADWKNLIKTGNEAIKQHINFYYLKIRLGIAYFNLKSYRKAITYLYDAYRVDPENTFVASYLYKAYLLGGRPFDAYRLAKTFPNSLRKKMLSSQDHFINEAGISFKVDFLPDYTADTKADLIDQYVIKKNVYYGFDLLNYYKGGNLFYLNSGIIDAKVNHYYIDNNEQQVSQMFITQYEIYLANYSQITNGLNWALAFNNLVSTTTNKFFQSINFRQSRAITNTTVSFDFVGFTGVRKDINNFRVGITSTLGNINTNWQLMPAFELVYYPFGNANLYLYTSSAYKMEATNKEVLTDLIIKSGLGLRLGPFFVETNYTEGNMYHYIENDALIVHNDDEKMSQRYELSFVAYLLKRKLKLYLKGQQYTKTNFFWRNTQQEQLKYNNKTIITGILWKI